MILLIDLALALMVLAGALFLGSVALALYKEVKKGNK
jgi:hypothetical protein